MTVALNLVQNENGPSPFRQARNGGLQVQPQSQPLAIFFATFIPRGRVPALCIESFVPDTAK